MTKIPEEPPVADDPYRTFMRLFTRHEGALRCLVRTLLPTWDDVDEVMQDVSIVAWTKFERFDPQTNFARWAATIARFEVLNYRRTKARDRLVFDEDLIQLIADECEKEFAQSERERRALNSCLDKLPAHQRELVVQVYSDGQKIKPLAEKIGVSPNALYKTLGRLRLILFRCVEETLSGAATKGELR